MTGPPFLEGSCRGRGDDPQGGWQFFNKKNLKSGIFNDKKSL